MPRGRADRKLLPCLLHLRQRRAATAASDGFCCAKMIFFHDVLLEFSTFSRQVEAEAKVPNYHFTEESRERHHFLYDSKLALDFELFSCSECVFATH